MANTFYTSLNITKGENDTKNFTAILNIVKPKNTDFVRQIGDDKKVATYRTAFSNCEKKLSNALGVEITPNEKGAVWCDVDFWNALADRFQKFMGDRDSIRVVLMGRLTLDTWTTKDGTPAQRVRLSANDFFALPTGTGAAPAATPVTAPAADAGQMEEIGGDDDLPF